MSKPLTLNKVDWVKVGKGGLIAIVSAFLTYATHEIVNIDWGSLTPLIMGGWSVLSNLVRKWIFNSSQ